MAPPPEPSIASTSTISGSNGKQPRASERVPALLLCDKASERTDACTYAGPQPRSRSCAFCSSVRWCRSSDEHRGQRQCKRAATSVREIVDCKDGLTNTSPDIDAQVGYITPLLLSTPVSGFTLQARRFRRPCALLWEPDNHCIYLCLTTAISRQLQSPAHQP